MNKILALLSAGGGLNRSEAEMNLTFKGLKKPSWTDIAGVFAASILIIAFRNLDPFVFPTIYAEDGKWAGAVLSNGMLTTAFGIREFPVLGLAGMLKLGLTLVDLLFSGDISYLPQVYFVIATLFIASIATLAFTSFSTTLPLQARIVLWLAVLFMPVSSSGNEIFGRILNLGFLFPVFQYLLLAKVLEGKRDLISVGAALAFSLVAGWTFPVCIGITLVAAILLFDDWRHENRHSKCHTLHIALILVSVVILNFSALSIRSFTSKGGAALPFSLDGLIEFTLARTWLYPIVAGFYNRLSNIVVLAVGTTILTVVVFGIVKASKQTREAKRRLLFVAAAFFGYYLATVLMRSGFTSLYGSYQITYPDRYYYGLNVLAVFLWVLIAATLSVGPPAIDRWRKNVLYGVITIGMLAIAPRQLELRKPASQWSALGTFEYSLCAHVWGKGRLPYDPSQQTTAIPIYPLLPDLAWRMSVPVDRLSHFDEKRCAEVFANPRKQPH